MNLILARYLLVRLILVTAQVLNLLILMAGNVDSDDDAFLSTGVLSPFL